VSHGSLKVTATYRNPGRSPGPRYLGPGHQLWPILRYLTQTAPVPVLINAPPLSEREAVGVSGSQSKFVRPGDMGNRMYL